MYDIVTRYNAMCVEGKEFFQENSMQDWMKDNLEYIRIWDDIYWLGKDMSEKVVVFQAKLKREFENENLTDAMGRPIKKSFIENKYVNGEWNLPDCLRRFIINCWMQHTYGK